MLIQAQDKPLRNYSKKELLALAEQQALQLSAHQRRLDSLSARYQEQQQAFDILRDTCEKIRLQYYKLRAAPPQEIEVLDLYSFGYQPFKNNERQYQAFLEEARQSVLKARMHNIKELVAFLQSPKIDAELKKLMFAGFQTTYAGLFDHITQEQLTKDYASLEESLKTAIRQKTNKELELISKENRWIVLLESN